MGQVWTRTRLNSALEDAGWSRAVTHTDLDRCVIRSEVAGKAGLRISGSGNALVMHSGNCTIKGHVLKFECSANYNPYTGSNKSVIAYYKDGVLESDYWYNQDIRGTVTASTDWDFLGDTDIFICNGTGFPISEWEVNDDLIQFKWTSGPTPTSFTEDNVDYEVSD